MSLLLATACGGSTVDLGHDGRGRWSDAPEQRGGQAEPQTIFETQEALVFGIVASDSTLFALVGDDRNLELVSCPIARCGSHRSVLYRSPAGVSTRTWFTSIVIVGDHLVWKLSNGEQPLGVASCPKAGCESPSVVPLNIFSGDDSGIAADESSVYVTDEEGALLRLSPVDGAPSVVRQGLAANHTGPMVAAGDFVYFTSERGQAVYRVRKDGTSDAELLARGEAITGLAASDHALYYSTQILDGSIVECALRTGVCGEEVLVSKQRWPAGVRIDGGELFWANGAATFASESGPIGTTSVALWSCDLPACDAPRERVRELFLAENAGERGISLQPGNFTFSRDFVLWIEESKGSRRVRRLAR